MPITPISLTVGEIRWLRTLNRTWVRVRVVEIGRDKQPASRRLRWKIIVERLDNGKRISVPTARKLFKELPPTKNPEPVIPGPITRVYQ